MWQNYFKMSVFYKIKLIITKLKITAPLYFMVMNYIIKLNYHCLHSTEAADSSVS